MHSEHFTNKEIQEIKESQKRIEAALLGSVQNGKAIPGMFEEVRKHSEDIAGLQKSYGQIQEINKSIESLKKYKYYVIGGTLVLLFALQRLCEFIASAFSGLFVHPKL